MDQEPIQQTPAQTPPRLPRRGLMKSIIQPEKRPKYFKVAIVIISILLLVGMAELAYLLNNQFRSSLPEPSPAGTQRRSFAPLPLPPSPSATALVKLNQSSKEIYTDKARQAIDILDVLKSKSEFLQEATISTIISGIVVETKQEAGNVNGANYSHILRLKNNNNQTLNYYFTAEEMKKAKVFILKEGTTTESSFAAIKRDDVVYVSSSHDLLDNSLSSRILFRVQR